MNLTNESFLDRLCTFGAVNKGHHTSRSRQTETSLPYRHKTDQQWPLIILCIQIFKDSFLGRCGGLLLFPTPFTMRSQLFKDFFDRCLFDCLFVLLFLFI